MQAHRPRPATVRASLVLALCALGIGAASAAEPPPLPPEVVREAGLDKLTGSEREALYRWIREHLPQTAVTAPAARAAAPVAAAVPGAAAAVPAAAAAVPAAAAAVPAAAPVAAAAPAVAAAAAAAPLPERATGLFDWGPDIRIETRIISKFDGWTGRTFFEMENGQVWQQRMDGRYQFRGKDTRVVITRGRFGLNHMTLVETGRWIGVKQVR